MRVFVITIPKSGTYLMREILEQIGFDSSYLHISKNGTYDYSKISFEDGRRDPKKCFTQMPFKESLAQIPQNSFAVGHIKYSRANAMLLKPFKLIFLGREPKETI